jgi:nucleoside 2-deoxyribosyltransferase
VVRPINLHRPILKEDNLGSRPERRGKSLRLGRQSPGTEEMLNASLGGGPGSMSLRIWTFAERDRSGQSAQALLAKSWKFLRVGGDKGNIKSKQPYKIDIIIQGSVASFFLDGVEVARDTVSQQLAGKQVGVFCASKGDIHFRNFKIESRRPQAFVVMQFNTPEYEALFKDVIEPVCIEMGLDPYRADFTHMPGLVIEDIRKQIAQSRVIIAEMTPVNGNVYYEVGYADALNKPVILIADKKVGNLSFDLRPYRTIFYENSIGGKRSVETALKKYLTNIMLPGSQLLGA